MLGSETMTRARLRIESTFASQKMSSRILRIDELPGRDEIHVFWKPQKEGGSPRRTIFRLDPEGNTVGIDRES